MATCQDPDCRGRYVWHDEGVMCPVEAERREQLAAARDTAEAQSRARDQAKADDEAVFDDPHHGDKALPPKDARYGD